MGIVNITPDSFSDGGVAFHPDQAVARAAQLVAEGAHIVDLGAESTRPGALPVGESEELDRLMPVLERILALPVPISVDTTKPVVMREVLRAGASMINDVCAFQVAGAIEAVASTEAGLCVMHMQGEPRTMQANPVYADVVGEVGAFLDGRIQALARAGVALDRIAIDPGFGFGKTLAHNLALLGGLRRLGSGTTTLMAGVSRKSMLGQITGRPADQRLAASLAAAVIAVEQGADIVRVHDVAATRDALAVVDAVRRSGGA